MAKGLNFPIYQKQFSFALQDFLIQVHRLTVKINFYTYSRAFSMSMRRLRGIIRNLEKSDEFNGPAWSSVLVYLYLLNYKRSSNCATK